MKKRCEWCGSDSLTIAYHDDEWGMPVHDDRVLFEFPILEGAQVGLSWLTILKKRWPSLVVGLSELLTNAEMFRGDDSTES